jgi:hypothetical protein
MPFSLLWPLLWPLLRAALGVILPWLVSRIAEDVKAGRVTTISNDEVKTQLQARKESIRMAYKAGGSS